MVAAPPGPGVGLQPGFEYPAALEQYVVDLDEAALLHRETGAS
jgi:hypothetical protein